MLDTVYAQVAESNSWSTFLGGASIGCWIIVYSPQIIENYHLKSGEGLAVGFVVVWLLGDLCNLVGAALGGLLPTVIILGLYYTICDIILLFQIYFYRWLSRQKSQSSLPSTDGSTEESPLLTETPREGPVQNTRKSYKPILEFTGALLFVVATGLITWWVSSRPKDTPTDHSGPKVSESTIQVIGWASAILYLGARVPQIFKNFKTKCEGLSPALFLFAIAGNTTYALSICAASMERQYLIRNGSWLAGSALTVFLDITVVTQFFYYQYRLKVSREHEHVISAS